MEMEGSIDMKKRYKRMLLSIAGVIVCLVLWKYMLYAEGLYDETKQKEKQLRNLVEVELLSVVDGDTIRVKLNDEERKVRLIGIDAPESVHADEARNTKAGELASDFVKDILKDYTKVYLQYDQEQQDQYGRELCYVWLANDVNIKDEKDIDNYMLNAIILQEGFAEAKSYYPNIFYAEYFEELSTSEKISSP